MNPEPTEQRVRPRPPCNDRRGAAFPKTPSRLLVVEERALPNGVAPSRSGLPVAEHLVSAPSTRRMGMVESVAIQIFSGAIEFGLGETKRLEASEGIGQHGWPLMLSRSQLCVYLGASWPTLKNVLTVRPVDMGANIVRYNREQIDQWAASLPAKDAGLISEVASPADQEMPIDTTAAALARARERGSQR